MIHSLRVSFGKWTEGQAEEPAGERFWRQPNLPERAEFVAALENMVGDVEPPFLISPARVEIETHTDLKTLEVDQWEDEEGLAGYIWAWAVSAGQDFT